MFNNTIFQNAASSGKTVNFTYNGKARVVTVLAESATKFAAADEAGQFKVFVTAKASDMRVGSNPAKAFGFTNEYAQKALGAVVA